MKHTFEAHDDPDINAVWEWFEFQIALIAEERGYILRALAAAAENIPGMLRPHQLQFIDLTRGEVEEFFDAQRGHLELLTMFDLLVTTEAILRIEFSSRVAARKKDNLSRRFREINKTAGQKIRLDEDILDPMKEEGMPAVVLGAFRATLKLRHWLAHGRHWHPKLGQGYTPGDVFDIARALIDSIPPS